MENVTFLMYILAFLTLYLHTYGKYTILPYIT